MGKSKEPGPLAENVKIERDVPVNLDLTKELHYRIMYRMKVTAIIPDQLVEEVRKASGGKNITDSLIVALREWIEMKRIRELNAKVAKRPLSFHEGYSAGSVRELNRKR